MAIISWVLQQSQPLSPIFFKQNHCSWGFSWHDSRDLLKISNEKSMSTTVLLWGGGGWAMEREGLSARMTGVREPSKKRSNDVLLIGAALGVRNLFLKWRIISKTFQAKINFNFVRVIALLVRFSFVFVFFSTILIKVFPALAQILCQLCKAH